MSSFYITTPIYYVNDLPHIGHIYTTVVADTAARYRRLCGDQVFFLTGTDEHGQKIERAATESGLQPLELADRVVSRYHELWRELAISNNDFIRTTESRHKDGVVELIRRIQASDDFYLAQHEGWYCAACETFYTKKELTADSRCPVHERPTEWQSEQNVFFRLSAYQERLLEWYREHPESVQPRSRANEVCAFVESGLRDLSVSRTSLSWGIPFPGCDEHTVYVWLDALTNYISALGFGQTEQKTSLFHKFWQSSDSVRLHLVGKDILRFHAVFWPAFLMSAGLPLPTTVWAHGWWLRDERKMSKSVGNVVRPEEILEKFGSDSLRYFLLREMVFGQDANYSDEAFVDRYNADLANDLGNSISRLVSLSRRAFENRTPPQAGGAGALQEAARGATEGYHEAMQELAFQRALESLWKLLAEANQYLVANEPWNRIKDEGASSHVAEVLWNGMEAVRVVATGLLPVMPGAARQALAALGAGELPSSFEALTWGGLPTGAELPKAEAVFPRIDKAAFLGLPTAEKVSPTEDAKSPDVKPPPEEKPSSISIEQFFQSELRVATVIAAETIPQSKKLLKLTVSLGEESRTLVAGIAGQYKPEDVVGRQVVVVTNLEPAQLMGVESQGMILAASVDGLPVLLQPAETVPNGTPVK